MARPRKSRSDKASGTPAAEPAPGHNSALSDEERQALHFRHVAEYERALEVKKTSAADFKNCAKRIKAEGGSIAAVKISIALKTPEGEEAFQSRLAKEIEVAKWNGIGVQLGLFGEDTDRTPLVDRAREEGKRAGMKGEPRRSPYQGDAEQAWFAGWSDGQEVLASDGFRAATSQDFNDAMPAN